MKIISMKKNILILVFLALVTTAGAQGFLQKPVTLSIANKRLAEVLKAIGKQGGFYFSYNSKVIPGDKIVSITVVQQTVKETLDRLLGGTCTYKETAGHIILQQAGEKWYTLSGYVLDATTGMAITDASVYERHQLVAALTDQEGYFRIRLLDKFPVASITISKEWYLDTSIVFAAGTDQVCRLPVSPIHNIQMNDVVITQKNKVADSWLARLFLSSNLRAQGRNISGYIASRPVQASFIPGLGTHGKLSGQVVNKFSLNVLGGYTAGAKGAEIGGIFNIDREHVEGVQVAGVCNIVGGKTSGVQVAGVYNSALDSVEGVQVAGVINNVAGTATGVVVAGVYNQVRDDMNGTQVSGVVNISNGAVTGIQAAGIANYTKGKLTGIQFAGIFNYVRTFHGMQIGLVNVSDSADGYMLGLVNWAKNGYHKVAVYSNEITHVNVSVKTGNANLYTVFTGGLDIVPGKAAYAFGIGAGRDTRLGKRWMLNTEFSMQHVFLGTWDHPQFIYRLGPSIRYRFGRLLSIYFGPSLSMYEARPVTQVEGYKSEVMTGDPLFKVNDNLKVWHGFQVGLELF
jgi:hypothetical protein